MAKTEAEILDDYRRKDAANKKSRMDQLRDEYNGKVAIIRSICELIIEKAKEETVDDFKIFDQEDGKSRIGLLLHDQRYMVSGHNYYLFFNGQIEIYSQSDEMERLVNTDHLNEGDVDSLNMIYVNELSKVIEGVATKRFGLRTSDINKIVRQHQ